MWNKMHVGNNQTAVAHHKLRSQKNGAGTSFRHTGSNSDDARYYFADVSARADSAQLITEKEIKSIGWQFIKGVLIL